MNASKLAMSVELKKDLTTIYVYHAENGDFMVWTYLELAVGVLNIII